MTATIADHFPAELSLLRDTAQVFARENPALAAALHERAGDPDVERLLEGVAFLTAGLRARLDQAGDRVAHALADLVLPHALRPLPAATVVELRPNTRALRARHPVPKGRPLHARPIAGTACRFRTCLDVDLLPLELLGARPGDGPADSPSIDLQFALRAPLVDPVPLRLFLHHPDLAQAATLFLWLTRHLTGLTVRTAAGAVHRLPARALAPLAPGPHPVYPWPDTAPAGHRALLELFTIPERFLFVELTGLHALGLDDPGFTLRLELERPPPLPAALTPTSFRLHCTPAINLFEAPGEPIVRDPRTRELLVRADGVDPRHMEVHDVTAVHAIARRHGRRRDLLPFHAAPPGRPAPRFSLRRARSPIDGALDTYLALHDPDGAPPELDDEILSLQLLCTNRDLPRELQPGDLTDELPGGLCRGHVDITPLSPPTRLAAGDEALWHLLSHLAVAQRGPADAPGLRALLRLYNVHAARGGPRGRAGERQIDAVRDLRREPVTRLVRGAPVRAHRTTVDLDERALGGPGIACLFGHVLDALFASQTPLGGASELHVALTPSQQTYAWPTRLGE